MLIILTPVAIILTTSIITIGSNVASITKLKKKNGKFSYKVTIRLAGYKTQVATFSRLTDARKWEAQTESAIREGKYFNTIEAKRHTLAEAIDRYIKKVLPTKPKSAAKQKSQLAWWKKKIGEKTLAKITRSVIAEHRDILMEEKTYRGSKRGPATTIRYLAVLSHLFTIAIKEWEWTENNPVLKITKPKEPKGRSRFLSKNERESLLAACQKSKVPVLYPVVLLALSTGMRQGEIMNLRWSDVDLSIGRIILTETKNGETRSVPLAGLALKILKEHAKVRNLKSNLLFPGKNSEKPIYLRKVWLDVIAECSIEDFRFHDLRHTAASYLLMNGASLAELAGILGHKTLQMVQRYAHLSDEHTFNVVSSMNEKIFG